MVQYESVLTRTEHLSSARMSTVDAENLLDAIVVVVEPV
jgi:hypothetical protein